MMAVGFDCPNYCLGYTFCVFAPVGAVDKRFSLPSRFPPKEFFEEVVSIFKSAVFFKSSGRRIAW